MKNTVLVCLSTILFTFGGVCGNENESVNSFFPKDGATNVDPEVVISVVIPVDFGYDCTICEIKGILFEVEIGNRVSIKSEGKVNGSIQVKTVKGGSEISFVPSMPLDELSTVNVTFKFEDFKLKWSFTTGEMAPALEPSISLSTANLKMGYVALGKKKSLSFEVSNLGSGPLFISGISRPYNPSFSLGSNSCAGQVLKPGDSCNIPILFSPSSFNRLETTEITLFTNHRNIKLRCSGTGVRKVITNDPSGASSSRYYTRIAEFPSGNYCVTDAETGKAYVMNSSMEVISELDGLASPLGVAVSDAGKIYIGNHDRHNVEVFGPTGGLIQVIGDGEIGMPNDLKFGSNGNLYVVDSTFGIVRQYDPSGLPLTTIGDNILMFPVAIEIAEPSPLNNLLHTEIYIADRGAHNIKVFDEFGNFLRSFGRKVSSFGSAWEGRFLSLQDISVDASGNVHALDNNILKIQIFDPSDGSFLSAYDSTNFKLPLDLLITPSGDIVVTDPIDDSILNIPQTVD